MNHLLRITLPLYVIDQASKFAVLRFFPDPSITPPDQCRVITVIGGFFDLVRVHNTGMAFGGFSGTPYANIVFCGIAIAALIVVGVLWRRGAFPTAATRLAAALLVAGILGNFTDRLAHGYVVDFLSFNLGFMTWPSFNVADACISIAAFLLVVTALFQPRAREEE